MREIFSPNTNRRLTTRNSLHNLRQPSRKTKQGQNCLSFIGPSIWNKLPNSIKESTSANSFKHKLKDHFFNERKKKEQDVYFF